MVSHVCGQVEWRSMNETPSIEQAIEALRRQQPDEAASLLRALLASQKDNAEGWSLLGAALLGKNPAEAVDALQNAVRLEPQEPRWHLNYGMGLQRLGDHAGAEAACREAFVRSRGGLDTLVPWADSLQSLGRYGEAASLLREAVKYRPGGGLQRRLSAVLAVQGDAQGALDALQEATKDAEPSLNDRLAMAQLHMQLQQFQHASTLLDGLLAEASQQPEVAVAAAQLNRAKGRLRAAQSILSTSHQGASVADPAVLAALLEFDDVSGDVVGAAERLAGDTGTHIPQRRSLTFALARHFDRNSDYERAWDLAQSANALYNDGVVWQAEQHDQELNAMLRLYEQVEQVASDPEFGLVYIIGAPRSGGTLLQSLMSASRAVTSVGERGALLPWLFTLLSQGDDAALKLWKENAKTLRQADLAGLRQLDPAAESYVDKTTHHAHVAGLIARLHGEAASFIDCRRDPRDMAVSILFHDFPAAFPYSRSLTDIVDYLEFQRRAIEAWRGAGVPILDHNHDAFLDDPERGGAELFAGLGIPWQSEYLSPEARPDDTVQTFSAAQVREQLTTGRRGHWRHYREFLGDLPERLGQLA